MQPVSHACRSAAIAAVWCLVYCLPICLDTGSSSMASSLTAWNRRHPFLWQPGGYLKEPSSPVITCVFSTPALIAFVMIPFKGHPLFYTACLKSSSEIDNKHHQALLEMHPVPNRLWVTSAPSVKLCRVQLNITGHPHALQQCEKICCLSQSPKYHLSSSLPPTLPTTLRERHRFLLRICCSPCS